MLPKSHLFLSILFCILLFFLFPKIGILGLSLLFLSSLFIDADHMLYYSVKTKNFNPFKAFSWFLKGEFWLHLPKKEKIKYSWPIFIFHGIEFLILLWVFSIFFPIIKFVFLGVLLHLFLDYCHLLYYGIPIGFKLSPIYVFLRNKNKKPIY